MKISVIITVYNREKTIARCMESVLNQDFGDYELIVVDDGSTDGTPHIVRGYEGAFLSRLRIIRQANGGVAAARNTGLGAAQGDYVTYLDSDDYMLDGALSRMAAALGDGEYDQIVYDAETVGADGERRTFAPFHDGVRLEEGDITPGELLLTNPCPWNRLIRRGLFRAVFGAKDPFPRGVWYEDLAAIPMLAVATERAGYIAQAMVCYDQSGDSIMRHRGYDPHFDDIFPVCDRLRKALSFRFPVETEYLVWEHLLVTGGKRYLACRKRALMKRCAAYMAEYYPAWRDNPLVKREPEKKRYLASMICSGRYLALKLLGK